jgi:hypothetical protein
MDGDDLMTDGSLSAQGEQLALQEQQALREESLRWAAKRARGRERKKLLRALAKDPSRGPSSRKETGAPSYYKFQGIEFNTGPASLAE